MALALVLQGGGALGAYQAGVCEALAGADSTPDWIAGISIGAINAAIVAGNPPDRQVARLRTFWERVSSGNLAYPLAEDGPLRTCFNEISAAMVALGGVPGFFAPCWPPAWLAPSGSAEAISCYDTAPLRETLLELVDFERINTGPMRLSVGAVQVLTGNFVYFDSTTGRIGPEHIMASGALPPAFAPVIIDGEPYWDGGLVSNTPLQHVLDNRPAGDLAIIQVDLFNARGTSPQTLPDVARREKEIRYSSRTRLNTDVGRRFHNLHQAARRLAGKLPETLRDDPDLRLLLRSECDGGIDILHLINRHHGSTSAAMDYEFSRYAMLDHWAAGLRDAVFSLTHQEWTDRKRSQTGIATFDLTQRFG